MFSFIMIKCKTTIKCFIYENTCPAAVQLKEALAFGKGKRYGNIHRSKIHFLVVEEDGRKLDGRESEELFCEEVKLSICVPLS